MKVVFKFALAFFVAACACLVLFAWIAANREATRIERVVATGLVSHATGLRSSLEEAWRDRGYEAAERMAERFDATREIRVSLRRSPASPSTGAAPEREIAVVPGSGGRLVRVSFSVAGPGGEHATLELTRVVADGGAIILAELGDQLLAASALALVMGALAVSLGAIVIGGPLDRIVVQARRIGEGDLSHRLKSTGTDEIGSLKRELNAMCDRLEAAYARIQEESAARVETLEQLRHLDRLRTVGTIASSIAHELGTPLNVLLLRGHTLADGDVDRDEVKQAGQAVVAQVDKMSRIVRQLLEFARTRTAAKDTTGAIDVVAVARHAAALLTTLAKKHGVEIVLDAVDEVHVRGDFDQLEQALTNLIANGIQAMGHGGGRLFVRVRAGSEKATIEVEDEGEGMSPEVLEQAFEPFFTTKPRGHGTGLGLHVARGIVDDHGGTIHVTSQPGTGTTFTLTLPVIE